MLDLVFKHPQLIPNTIDFICSIQSSIATSSLPLSLTSQIVQFLSNAPLKQLLPFFPIYLVFIKHALAHPKINPVVRTTLRNWPLSDGLRLSCTEAGLACVSECSELVLLFAGFAAAAGEGSV